MTRKLTRNYSLSVRAKGGLNIRDVAPRFSSTKLAAAAIRGVLTLAVFSALLLIAARPAQTQTETVLYNFTGGSDGANPVSSLTSDGAGNFYGTTMYGGAFGGGTVFELSPNSNGGWTEQVIYSFCSVGGVRCTDGASPFGSVIFDSVGNLYGTTYSGGACGAGVVFELSPGGTSWTETVLSSCAGGTESGLIMDPEGDLYGTSNGGHGFWIFELSPSGGGWTEQQIYAGGYDTVVAGLTMDAAGNIFGASFYSVFELSPNGTGGWNPAVIHNFNGAANDGSIANGTPALDKAGNLYGTTYEGGAKNHGTVYELSPEKNGEWTEEILHSFGNNGVGPWAGIVAAAAGNTYGTTVGGGKSRSGTVYELVARAGAGIYKEKVLWSLNGTDGSNPYGSLILDRAGNLYGTTLFGGSSGAGVVFEVTGLPASKTATALTSSPNPSTYGQAVTFTAAVTSARAAPPDGETVTFKRSATVLGTGALSGGSTSFTTSTLKVGTNSITAVYAGDSNFAASTSKAVSQVVEKYATTTALSSSLNPSSYGQ